MNYSKKSLVLALLVLNVFAGIAFSQTRRTTPAARRKQPPGVRAVPATTRKPAAVAAAAAAPPVAQAATTTASGLTYIITERGDGQQLKAGDTVTVNYTGLLTNGTKFDSSLDRDQTFSFQLGARKVIKGWDEGVQQLRVGDRATFIIPPQLAYGEKGAGGVIPPNATLIFIIEVISVQ